MRSKEEILGEYLDLKTLGKCTTRKIFERAMDEYAEEANRILISEMMRYLPVIEAAENNPEIWNKLTRGTGIATANGYRNAIMSITNHQ